MIWPFKKTSTPEGQLYAVYNAIVAQSRQTHFYADWAVPDTVTGRFDMISLHMCVLFRRLRPAPGESKDFAQDLFDLFFKDMDRSLRELGVSDVGVPKKIEKMGNLFYGLLEKVTFSLDSDDQSGLAATINRNVFDEGKPDEAVKLADYLFEFAAELDKQPLAEIKAGNLKAGAAA